MSELSRLKPAAEQKPKAKKEKSKSQSGFTKLSVSLFRGPAVALSNKMPQVKQALLKSGRRDPPENYLATVIFATVCTIPLPIIGVLLLFVLNTPLTLILLPIPIFVFLFGFAMPWISYSSKSGSIDTELPYVISYLSILSGGGVSLLTTLRRISKVKLFPVLSKESKQILTDIDMYGLDPVSALDKEARSTPNKYLSDFLFGYTSILRSGGQLNSYMDAKIHEVFNHRLMRSRAAAGTIGIFAEAYVSATVVMGLCFYLIFTLQSVINRTGPSGITNAIYFSALFIPFISVVFFFLIDAVQVKDGPVRSFKNPIVPLLGFVAVPVIAFLPIDLPLHLKIGTGLIIGSVYPMIKFEREIRSRKAIENALPKFVRDIAEVRKTGLSPERCIQQVAGQNYGKLSENIKEMSAQISWGVPLRKVMENFANSIEIWSAKAIAFVLLEVVDLGGGTAKMFENMADFAQQMKEISRELKSSLRPLIVVPYFGAVMMVASTLMMMNFLTPNSTGAAPGTATGDTASIMGILLTGAVTQAWTMGFAAGKMGEGSVFAGFKHAIALVVLCIVTIIVLQFFLPGVK